MQTPVSPSLDIEREKISEVVIDQKRYPGLNRVAFIVGFVSTFIIGLVIGTMAIKTNLSIDDGGDLNP